MKLEMVEFQGVAVGIQLEAESEEEHRLLACLSGLKAEPCRGFRYEKQGAIFLCPNLPWQNIQPGSARTDSRIGSCAETMPGGANDEAR